MRNFLLVGAGGCIGSCLRYGIGKILLPLQIQFPLATLLSNLLAGFFIGFITELHINTDLMKPTTKLFLTTGMMGGLSTFSTFSLETVELFSKGRYLSGTQNILLNLTLSILGVLLGIYTAKLLTGKKA